MLSLTPHNGFLGRRHNMYQGCYSIERVSLALEAYKNLLQEPNHQELAEAYMQQLEEERIYHLSVCALPETTVYVTQKRTKRDLKAVL